MFLRRRCKQAHIAKIKSGNNKRVNKPSQGQSQLEKAVLIAFEFA